LNLISNWRKRLQTPGRLAANQGDRTMVKFFLPAFAVVAAAAAGMVPDAARARDYPFCIKGGGYESPVGDCSFDSYEQCQATASGRKAYCDVNPFFSYPETRMAHLRKRYAHR